MARLSKFTNLLSYGQNLGSMDLMDVLQERRSVRRYASGPVEDEQITSLLDAAETAPSAGNLRARKYIVVTKPDLQSALALAAYGQEHVASAPLLIVVCADIPRSSRRYGDRGYLYAIQDASSAIMCMLLAAHDMGLGACWTGAFDENAVKNILDVPDYIVVAAIISLGWPAEKPLPPPRRDMTEVVSWMVP